MRDKPRHASSSASRRARVDREHPRGDARYDVTVRGLFETHLTVADVPHSVAFYRDVVGLPVALELPERGAAFHWIGRSGQAMLGLSAARANGIGDDARRGFRACGREQRRYHRAADPEA